MTPERWQRVSQLYDAVLERPAPERDRFLADACRGDTALRREVESLLSQDDRQSPLDHPVWVPDDLLAEAEVTVPPDRARYNAGSPRLMRLAAGTRLGPYEIQSAIGAGGMGEVYRGRDTRLDRPVAIKILRPEIATDPVFRARFDREARTISQLDHPNICQLYDVGDQDGLAFLVMPFLEGVSLLEHLRRRPLPLPDALHIAIALASALTYAHGRGVLHRDIKPQNVLMLHDGRVKLVDFGVAKPYGLDTAETIAETAPALTRLGQTLGTLEYMSPEQLAGRAVDGRSDLFSLGIVVYQLVTGTHPFQGATPAVTASAILGGKYSPPPATSPAAAALDRILRRMLATQPADRYPTTADCLADLRALEHDSGPRAAVPPRAASSPLRAIAIVGAIAVVAALVVVVWRGRSAEPSSAPPAAMAASPALANPVTLWLDVTPNAGASKAATFRSLGDHVYPRGSAFRVNIVSAPSGHVYLLSDDTSAKTTPTGLTLLYPRGASQSAEAGHPIQTDWFAFTGAAATDRLWLLSSTTPLDELETLAARLEASDLGTITDVPAAGRVRALLQDASTQAQVTRDAAQTRIMLSGGPILVYRLELQHD